MRYIAADRNTLAAISVLPASSSTDRVVQAEAIPPREARLHKRVVTLVCTEIPLLATLLIRLAMNPRSFDVFGDEVYYTDIGHSVINGGFPRFQGGLFFLHGPGFFYLEAGWERLVGSQHGLLDSIYEMRLLNALLAAATAVVLVRLAARAGSPWAGLAAGVLYAVEPFCIRQNGRVMLETAMMLWVLLGYLIFSSLIGRPLSRGTAVRAVAAGLIFGFAMLTKDEAALLILLPLLVAAALRWGPSRTLTSLTYGATVVPYVVYLTVVAANGHIGALWVAKTVGIRRMLGLIQATGFHSSGGGSLLTRLFAEGHYFGTTYVTLALAVPLAMLMLRRGGQRPRMLGLLYCAAAVALGYALTGGTLEEQELYLLIVPSLLVIPVAATLLRDPGLFRKKSATRTAAAPLAAVLVLILGVNLATCVQWRQQPDDGIAKLLSYMAIHVPPGARVTDASGSGIIPFALAGQYHVVPTVTVPAALVLEHVRYVVIPWAEVHGGYADVTTSQVRHLVSHSRLIFSFHGRTYGDLALYRVLPDGHHTRAVTER
jgi:4-amino-4-deoxy-L-arabinose transferase-like glycosyltransferase